MSSKQVSDDVWIVPQIGNLPTAEFRKLRRLLHDLGRRNIYMRYKYIGRLYHSGLLKQIVELLNNTSDKRKRSKDEGLPDPKRKSTDEDEEDSALTDYDSDRGDSSDDAEDEEEDEEDEEDEEVNNDGREQLAKEENENESRFKDSIFHGLRYPRRNVSTQTDGAICLD